VIAWADSEIEALRHPSNSLIDISLGRQLPRANIISLLTELAIETSDSWSTRHGLSLLADQIRTQEIDIPTVILNCHKYLQTDNLLYDDGFIVFVVLEDDVSLIRDGIFGEDRIPELRDELLAALDQMARETRIVK
jgi:hypothetical protein